MDQSRPSNWPLVLILIWYGLLLAGSALMLLIGMIFGSEVYRDRPVPIIEWVIIAGPFLASCALIAATIMLWNSGKRSVAYALCAATLIAAPILLFGAGVLGI